MIYLYLRHIKYIYFFIQKYQCVEYKLQQKGIKYDSIHFQLQKPRHPSITTLHFENTFLNVNVKLARLATRQPLRHQSLHVVPGWVER